ncbi:probable polygalacturonase [Dendrobium catenatum]|uniref:probable polygalacturonase n=1 Tax=Dendrobium catenatum TaxID=906689 RepID=UPI0009F5F233|nr:probable polygalacturonase [Dendrobium catenatum]XP_028553036.1 probable polygalacturonase [Dendrobium catenatum]
MLQMFSPSGRIHLHHHRRWLPTKLPYPLTLFTVLWMLVFGSIFAWQNNSVDVIRHFGRMAPPRLPVPRLRPVVFNLTDFDAAGDGKTMNTGAFERAVETISRLANSGGGQLNVPRGRWLTAPFNITSHITIFLEEGAVLLGIQDESYWPLLRPLPSYGYGREHIGPRYGSLIHGQHLKDVVITGHNGIIDGQGQSWWAKHKKKLLNYTRGPLVQFMWSRDIVISNITLRNSPFWTIHPYDCKNVTLSGLTILAPLHEAPNTDGIDPDSCQNMLIENCFISVGDDGIAIKSGWDQYGIAYGRPSSNILIRNVTLRSIISAGLSIGSEMSGGVANVTAENVLIFESRRGVRIKTAPGRGGYIQNIEFRNLTLDNVRTGIVIKTDYNEHADAGFDPQALPVIDGISFEGVRGRGVRVPVRMHGSEEIPVRGVKFRDLLVGISYKKKRIFQCSYVEGRVVGPVFPAPCEDLDLYDEEGRLVKRATHKNDIVEVDYDG